MEYCLRHHFVRMAKLDAGLIGEIMENYYQKLQVLESDEKPLATLERLRAMNGPLLAWYRENARVLPWRSKPTPYRVWISEIMLQQTRVEAVKPYFERFMEELPDVADLADANEEKLLKLWEGLGYYSRARNLQKAAKVIMEDHGGQIPDEYEKLLGLPGIGSYTAGAIASIAYGKPAPAVDGNVLRVLSRILASREDILKQSVKRQFEDNLRKTMPKETCSSFNQGLIEIGAMVCIPNGQPKCRECPLYSVCLAGKRGLTAEIPYRSPKKPRRIEERTILLIESGDQIAIQKRPAKGLLASLYEFPGFDGRLSEEEIRRLVLQGSHESIRHVEWAGDAKHIFSHVEWHMTGYLVEVDKIPTQYLAVEREELQGKYPLPAAFSKYIQFIIGKS